MLVGASVILTIFPVTKTVLPALSVHVTEILFTPATNHVRVKVHHVVQVANCQLTFIVANEASLHVPVIVFVLQAN